MLLSLSFLCYHNEKMWEKKEMIKRKIITIMAFIAFSAASFSDDKEKFNGLMYNGDGKNEPECLHATLPVGTVVEIKPKGIKSDDKRVVKETIAKPLPGGKLASKFGGRRCRGCSRNHKGVDLTKKRGSKKVVAALDGEVAKSGWGSGFGRLVLLNHKKEDGTIFKTTLYGHLRMCKVRPGQKVKKGQTIGILGNSGRSKGRHLHFEIANNKTGGYDAHVLGKKENPIPYLNGKVVQEKKIDINTSTVCVISGKTHFGEGVITVSDEVANDIGMEDTGLMKVAVKVLVLPKSG